MRIAIELLLDENIDIWNKKKTEELMFELFHYFNFQLHVDLKIYTKTSKGGGKKSKGGQMPPPPRLNPDGPLAMLYRIAFIICKITSS